MAIKLDDYNKAKNILSLAGSKSAEKSHTVHGGKVPQDSWGTALLTEATAEFRIKDKGKKDLVHEVTKEHHAAVLKAKKQMFGDKTVSW